MVEDAPEFIQGYLDMSVISNFLSSRNSVDFDAINRVALNRLDLLVRTWLPGGKRRGDEWVALNPTRPDRKPGSFSVNLKTGKWGDFSTQDFGGDPISLAAYLFGTSQTDAARTLAISLGVR